MKEFAFNDGANSDCISTFVEAELPFELFVMVRINSTIKPVKDLRTFKSVTFVS